MPKNMIWDTFGPFACTDAGEIRAEDLEPGDGHLIYERAAILRWGKASNVSHGTHGTVELGVAKVQTADNTEVERQYVTLTRSTLNDLIRCLRTARDQAFGRDE